MRRRRRSRCRIDIKICLFALNPILNVGHPSVAVTDCTHITVGDMKTWHTSWWLCHERLVLPWKRLNLFLESRRQYWKLKVAVSA